MVTQKPPPRPHLVPIRLSGEANGEGLGVATVGRGLPPPVEAQQVVVEDKGGQGFHSSQSALLASAAELLKRPSPRPEVWRGGARAAGA